MSTIAGEITKAIAAHGMWKTRLMDAIDTGKSEFSADVAGLDDRCDFGKWLYGLTTADRSEEHWKKIQQLHAAFHKEASRVLALAVAGRGQEAKAELAAGSTFSTASAQLTVALMDWKKKL
jgi:methyl-accepting chemotaxis protein